MAWSIFAAKGSRYRGRIVVSTDSEEFSSVARAYGAETPFLRPSELAGDAASSLDAVLHALDWLSVNDNYRPAYVVLLQPTSPLRQSADIDAAIDLAIEKRADAVVSVSPVSDHPYLSKILGPSGELEDFVVPTRPVNRRQELPEVFVPNGAIYLIRPEVLAADRTWYPRPTYAYAMPPERSIDVDTPWDLYLADLILRNRICRAGGTTFV